MLASGLATSRISPLNLRLQLCHRIQQRDLFSLEPNAEHVLQLEYEVDVTDGVPRRGIPWARVRRDR